MARFPLPKPLPALLLCLSLLGACSSGLQVAQSSERQAKAMAMWQVRCKTAGEKIYKTVENVEGIHLMKIRTTTNFGDQFKLDDPYGHDSTGDTYILSFLQGFYHQRNEAPVPGSPPRTGYRYVEAQDATDGKRYRYRGRIEQPGLTDTRYSADYKRFVMEKTEATSSAPRYGVTYDDISTQADREYWIAGSSLKVVDLQTNEVIAERVGYMVDWAQGSQAGQRSPWLFAADNACPGFQWNPGFQVPSGRGAGEQGGQTLTFVEKVLKPSR